jgi:hypothetical protein
VGKAVKRNGQMEAVKDQSMRRKRTIEERKRLGGIKLKCKACSE